VKSFSPLLFRIAPLSLFVLIACKPKAEIHEDRCGPNLQLTPTSNFCVSTPQEVTKQTPSIFIAKKDIEGINGKSTCHVKKGDFLRLLPPGGVKEGKEAALFSADNGCVVQLAFHIID